MERLDWARDLLVLRSYSCMVPCSRPVYVCTLMSVLLAPLLLRAPLRLLRGTLAVRRGSGGYLRQGC